MKKLILLVMLCLSVYFVSADLYNSDTPRFTKNQYSTFNITQPCDVEGVFCDSSIDCYIGVISPYDYIIINNGSMSDMGSGIKYYTFSNTSQTGTYKSFVTCTNGTASNTAYFTFNIEKPQFIQANYKIFWVTGFFFIIWAVMIFLALKFRIHILGYAAIIFGFILALLMISIHEIFFILFCGIDIILVFFIAKLKN